MARSRRRPDKPHRKGGATRSEPRARDSTNMLAEPGLVHSRRGRRHGATMTLDIASLTSLSNEARQAVAEAFDAVEHWQKEIRAANERCLTKVCDQVTNAHRALGWPEQVTSAANEHFLKASSIQSQMIEQAMEAWQRQLQVHNWRSGIPGSQFHAPTPSQVNLPTSELMRFGGMTLTPFMLWMEAAQAWQRAWVSTVFGGAPPEPSSTASTGRGEPLARDHRPRS
jgi:hypothetical protein